MSCSVLKTLFDQYIFKDDSINTKIMSTSAILVAFFFDFEQFGKVRTVGYNVTHKIERVLVQTPPLAW